MQRNTPCPTLRENLQEPPCWLYYSFPVSCHLFSGEQGTPGRLVQATTGVNTGVFPIWAVEWGKGMSRRKRAKDDLEKLRTVFPSDLKISKTYSHKHVSLFIFLYLCISKQKEQWRKKFSWYDDIINLFRFIVEKVNCSHPVPNWLMFYVTQAVM